MNITWILVEPRATEGFFGALVDFFASLNALQVWLRSFYVFISKHISVTSTAVSIKYLDIMYCEIIYVLIRFSTP